jgi:hypothetical protein
MRQRGRLPTGYLFRSIRLAKTPNTLRSVTGLRLTGLARKSVESSTDPQKEIANQV